MYIYNTYIRRKIKNAETQTITNFYQKKIFKKNSKKGLTNKKRYVIIIMQGEKHERRQKNSPLKSQVKKIKKILKKP